MFNLIFLLLLLCGSLCGAPSESKNAYAQLSALTTQNPGRSGNAILHWDSVDATLNMDVSADKKSVIVKEPGVYFIMTSVQAGSIDQTTTGYVDIWLIRNNKQLANTGSRVTVDVPTGVSINVSQSVLSLQAGDTLGIGYSVSGPSLGIVYLQPEKEPGITSIFTILKLR